MSTNDDIQAIAEALIRLQWRRGPGGPRGFGPFGGFGGPGGPGEHADRHGFGGPRHSEDFPFGGRRHPGGPFAGRGRALLRLLTSLIQAGTALGVSALGDAIGVDQPRASRLVTQGVELGLLRREADPDDARRTLIALTDKGRAITDRFRGAQLESVDQALSSFTEEERAQLARLLTRLAEAWPK
ncbi:MarR family winged helix-turn-helix transcriptional regulator [Brevibacterium spongiae]|uniref:MarR family transcriptional regulator n=1 Tax=Brevibacterium spongiae TaxID=2909672 RepID=A0ABY5SMT9_9MICO|nr:MarR family transcriptional regulator [Brevibacterium spongiae]UVI35843.1 MarR family transcriptional regulator [Brevibacterium spongiae]